MFAIAFDLVVKDTKQAHPKGVAQAYVDIGAVLGSFGFRNIQGSVYAGEDEDIANLVRAILALRSMPWFPKCVRDVRAFRVEQWSDFTSLVKEAGNGEQGSPKLRN
jgi:virulence-associated protein VapD